VGLVIEEQVQLKVFQVQEEEIEGVLEEEAKEGDVDPEAGSSTLQCPSHSCGIHRNETGIHWNGTGIELENQCTCKYMYINTCIQM
jgi:hypothetical protein